MSVLSILLLLALADAAAGLFLRKHICYGTALSWTDAQTYCRDKYVDLSTIDTQWEFDSFRNQSGSCDGCWIGLGKKPTETIFTRWSDGTVLNFTNWKTGEPDKTNNEGCVFTNNDQWENEDCTKAKKPFCYTWAPKMIMVQEMKTWNEALVHCRTFYTDLVSLATETDHFLVNRRSMEILTPTFWTSLRFMDGSWFWVNQDSPWNLTSMPSCPARPFRCGARNIRAGVWENRDCEEKMNFICYQNIW